MLDPIDTFREEAREHLEILESSLLELEEDPNNKALIDSSFRAMHTIKGAAGMFGYDGLSDFTHHLETALDKVRDGEYSISDPLISIILDAKDHIDELLEEPEVTHSQQLRAQSILDKLAAHIPSDDAVAGSQAQSHELGDSGPETTANGASQKLWKLKIIPSESAFSDGFDLIPILRELSQLGDTSVTTFTEQLPELTELDPEMCHLTLEVLLTTSQTEQTIMDTFIFVEEDWSISLSELDPMELENDQIGEILVNRGDVDREAVEQSLSTQNKTGEILKDAGLVDDEKINAALGEQKAIRESKRKQQQQDQETTVKVATQKLDLLMDQVGELVIVQARMKQLSKDYDDETLVSISEELDRLSMNLRDNTFDIRMLPIGTTFSRFRRLVRDLSKDLGKDIKLITHGAETELDKMVIDRLADPLVHLIRNSIDHGIEPPEERVEKNKDRQGLIHLSAEHQESFVVITIEDDGAGLDPDKILARAIERGIIREEDSLSKKEIFNLIFAPGFSTAEAVTDISGRGVGMDVVKRSIENLRGEVFIDSETDKGTTITVRLPMTLAIIEGLMVAVSDEKYVIPLSHVEECIEYEANESTTSQGQNQTAADLIRVRDKLVPFVSLRDWFDVSGERPEIEQIVLVRMRDQLFGLCIDHVVGQHQTVIKNLGKLFKGKTGLAGATILGDGGVAMIIDVNQLVSEIQTKDHDDNRD